MDVNSILIAALDTYSLDLRDHFKGDTVAIENAISKCKCSRSKFVSKILIFFVKSFLQIFTSLSIKTGDFISPVLSFILILCLRFTMAIFLIFLIQVCSTF